MGLIRFRNEHPAFAGEFAMPSAAGEELILEWRRDTHWARLEVDLAGAAARLSYSSPAGPEREVIA
jgi:sucrose phosphorylase